MSESGDKLWIITEGLIGTENPCKGVAQALEIEPVIKHITLNQPWKTLCPHLGFEQETTFEPKLSTPWPEILITNGRKAIAAARYIKKASNGKTFTIHLQDPRINAPFLDLIAAPAHDSVNAPNAIETIATPNMITPQILETAKPDFLKLGKMPSPRIAVLIGGKSKAYDMPRQMIENMIKQLSRLEGSLMITCSRRSGEENINLIDTALNKEGNFVWDGTGNNPYHAILAYADFILVTADSTSMVSESCSTGKPVYMIDLPGGSARINRFHKKLISYGALKKFHGTLESFTYEPLNDAQKVAEEIKKRFKGFT